MTDSARDRAGTRRPVGFAFGLWLVCINMAGLIWVPFADTPYWLMLAHTGVLAVGALFIAFNRERQSG